MCCFVGWSSQVLFKLHITFLCRSQLTFFSVPFVNVHVVHPYSSTEEIQLIAVHSFAMFMLKSLSVNEIILLRCVN